jgi:glycosyltransferase involved in cell wall biosynthesis
MRILKVTRCFFPALSNGGGAFTSFAIARQLVDRGHDVTVYASNLLDTERKMSERTETKTVARIRAVYFNTALRYRWDGFQPDVFDYLDHLRQFDVIHVYGFRDFLSTVVCSFAERSGVPYVIEPMGMLVPIVRSLRKKKLYDQLVGRRLVERASRIIVTSDQEAREAMAWGVAEEKLFLRRNGVDVSEFAELPPAGGFRRRLQIADGRPLVLFLGRVSRKKNPALLVQAFAEMKRRDSILAFVGPDDADGSLQEVVRLREKLGVQESVKLVGPLFGRDRVEALVDADIFVLPSSNENFANAVAEAVLCGTPVVVTSQCGIAPLVRDRAGLVIEPEKEQLKAAMARLLADERLRRQLSSNALAMKRELGWDEPVEMLERLYSRLGVRYARFQRASARGRKHAGSVRTQELSEDS